MGNKMSDVREHLFDALQALKDKDHPMELERAKAIADIGQTIINSAKVEVDYLKVTGQGQEARSEFFPAADLQPGLAPRLALPAGNGKASLEGKRCRDCEGEGRETPAAAVLPSGTYLCDPHWRKRSGMSQKSARAS